MAEICNNCISAITIEKYDCMICGFVYSKKYGKRVRNDTPCDCCCKIQEGNKNDRNKIGQKQLKGGKV